MREVIRLLRPYGPSLSATFLAFVFTLLVPPLSHRFPFALFIAAVMASAWHGGLRPGLLTTALSTLALAVIYFVLSATPAPDVELDYLPRLGMFVLVGSLASFLSHECKRAIQAYERFHLSLSGIGDGLIFTDVKGRVTFLNAIAQSLTGWRQEEAVDKPLELVFRLVREERRDTQENPAAEVIRNGMHLDLAENASLLSSNGTIPIDGRAAPIRDDGGNIIGVSLTFHEATQRRQAESRFLMLQRTHQELEERLQERTADLAQTQTALQEQVLGRKQAEERQRQSDEQTAELQEAKATLQERLAALLQTEEALRHEQETKHQELERRVADLSAKLAKADAARQKQAPAHNQLERRAAELTAELERANACLQEQVNTSMQAEESLRQSQSRLQALLEERTAEFVKANVSLQDKLDAARQAAEKLQQEKDFLESLINCSVDGILAFDREFRVTVWNPALERLAGIQRSSLLGRSVFEVFPSIKERGEDQYFFETLEGKSVRVQPGPLRASGNGRHELFETALAPLLGRSAEIVGGLAVVRALSESMIEPNGHASPDNGQTALLSEDDLAEWLSFN